MLIYLQRVHQLDFNKETFISRMHGANIKNFLFFKNIHKLCVGFLFFMYLVIMLLPYNNAVYLPIRIVAFSG